MKPEIGETYLKLSTALNPFDKRYAKVVAAKAGYVQFKTGTAADFMKGGLKSLTEQKFMNVYGPL